MDGSSPWYFLLFPILPALSLLVSIYLKKFFKKMRDFLKIYHNHIFYKFLREWEKKIKISSLQF